MYLIAVLQFVSIVLHFIAPRTATTIDDSAAELVDEVEDKLKS